jgi:hypothetical protein
MRKLSGGGGSRMAILLMVVRGYHFDRRLVVGRPALKKMKIIEVLPSRGRTSRRIYVEKNLCMKC